MKRDLSKSKYVAVFALTTLIFITGLLIGSYNSGKKLEQVSELQQHLRMDTMAMELQYLFLSQEPCETDTDILTEELYEIGEKLVYMENSLGQDNIQVRNLKEYYSLLEVRHWLFLKQIQSECSTNMKLILFFYSQDEDDCPKCVEQGYALTYLRKENENVRVYSFDSEISNPALDVIKKRYIYDGAEMPMIVIEDMAYYGFHDKNTIQEILKNHTLEFDFD